MILFAEEVLAALDVLKPFRDLVNQWNRQVLLSVTARRLRRLQDQRAFAARDLLRIDFDQLFLRKLPDRIVRYALNLTGDPKTALLQIDRLYIDARDLAFAQRTDEAEMNGQMNQPVVLDDVSVKLNSQYHANTNRSNRITRNVELHQVML